MKKEMKKKVMKKEMKKEYKKAGSKKTMGEKSAPVKVVKKSTVSVGKVQAA